MTEKLLQFIWAFGYFNKQSLTTIDGELLQILFPGSLNKNQGPDFTAGRIKIGATMLAGHVELHLKTSDWLKHGHQSDGNYKNVVLHVVYEHDVPVNDIPVLELSSRISMLLLQRYQQFMDNATGIACAPSLTNVKEIVWQSWKERLVVERLSRKADHALQLLSLSNQHWEETFWWMLARSFGGKINSDAFELVARSIPVNLLAKHKSSLIQIEALLFGQAGLFDDEATDDYPKMLRREHSFLKKKYNLPNVHAQVLFLRMRPVNFPTIRFAQLAALVQQSAHLFSKMLEGENLNDIKPLFDVTANDFWHYHYSFKQSSAFKKKAIGAEMVDGIVINTIVPVLFAYGHYHNSEKYKDKALRWLDETTAEGNSIIKEFSAAHIHAASAYDSQALLQLKNEYCVQKRCLECAVGNHLLREAAPVYETRSSLKEVTDGIKIDS